MSPTQEHHASAEGPEIPLTETDHMSQQRVDAQDLIVPGSDTRPRPAAISRAGIIAYRRQRIMEEFGRLVIVEGRIDATLDDVAVALGRTKPVIYSHFGSKADLWTAFLDSSLFRDMVLDRQALKKDDAEAWLGMTSGQEVV